ncbi:aminotransferase class IV [bacterium]|nr:aminotransferase class IV [bacterium]MDY3022299.1 aminotransferase class IV [Oliverpabstia sp.]
MITPDQGYFFGIGAFETVAVEEGNPVLLKEHYERLFRAMEFFHLKLSADELEEKVGKALEDAFMKTGRKVLKITASEKNLLVTTRENIYEEKHYEKGFSTDFCCVRRNETSPLTYHKTLNYGDCLREKHLAHDRGVDEPVFLNTKGIIAEGATTNVFFVKNGEIFTPSVECGLLPGIMRAYICRRNHVCEKDIDPGEIDDFDEMFLTNSLLGVMPVSVMGRHRFPSGSVSHKLLKAYREFCREGKI